MLVCAVETSGQHVSLLPVQASAKRGSLFFFIGCSKVVLVEVFLVALPRGLATPYRLLPSALMPMAPLFRMARVVLPLPIHATLGVHALQLVRNLLV